MSFYIESFIVDFIGNILFICLESLNILFHLLRSTETSFYRFIHDPDDTGFYWLGMVIDLFKSINCMWGFNRLVPSFS